jgi:hypothetical protein
MRVVFVQGFDMRSSRKHKSVLVVKDFASFGVDLLTGSEELDSEESWDFKLSAQGPAILRRKNRSRLSIS